jgi:hypothetical protein
MVALGIGYAHGKGIAKDSNGGQIAQEADNDRYMSMLRIEAIGIEGYGSQ